MRCIAWIVTVTLLCGLLTACHTVPAGTGDALSAPSTAATTTAPATTETTVTPTTTTTTQATTTASTTQGDTEYTQTPFVAGDGYAPVKAPMKEGLWYSLATLNENGKTPSDAVKALLDSYFTYRCHTFAKAQGLTVAEPEGLKISDEVRRQEENQRVTGLKTLKKLWDCQFAGAQVLYTVDGISGSSSNLVLRVHEAAYFYNWYEGYTTAATSDLSGYGIRHIIHIKNGIIQSDHYNEGRPTGVAIEGRLDDDEYWNYAGTEGNPEDLTDSPIITVDPGSPNFVTSYNPLKTLQYADAWALARNKTNFKDYHAVGGDCANFTSQSLAYGGLPQNGTWWWKGGRTGKGGYAWKTATGMYNYLVKSAKVGRPIAMIECIDETGRTARYNGQVVEAKTLFYAGSPVFYRWKGGFATDGDWSHATLCVGYLGDGTPAISCHTEDRYNFKWTYGGLTCEYSCVQLTPEPVKVN